MIVGDLNTSELTTRSYGGLVMAGGAWRGGWVSEDGSEICGSGILGLVVKNCALTAREKKQALYYDSAPEALNFWGFKGYLTVNRCLPINVDPPPRGWGGDRFRKVAT